MPDEPIPTTPDAKPPFLRRVRIRNYKSIAFCDVTLEPLTILVGRNATGKSNFLDALGFLRDVVANGVRGAVKLHGGGDAIVSRDAMSEPITLEIDVGHHERDEPAERLVNFAIEILLPPAGVPSLVRESFDFFYPTRVDASCYRVEAGRVTWRADGYGPNRHEWLDADRPFISWTRAWEPFKVFCETLETFLAYSFSPTVVRLPQQPTFGVFLERDGSNLASVYEATLKADPAAAKRAARYLNAVAESVKFAGVLKAGGYEILEFDTSENVDAWNGPPRKPTRFPAASMSDGTLRAFACIMAAFQTVAPYGSPSLVAIEEPEAALHPAAMRALVAAFDEATLRTQILLTTHSPDLLDAEAIKPDNVRVVQLIDGKTVIGLVDEVGKSIVDDGLASLGQLEREGRLKADLGDLARQAALAGAGPAHP